MTAREDTELWDCHEITAKSVTLMISSPVQGPACLRVAPANETTK